MHRDTLHRATHMHHDDAHHDSAHHDTAHYAPEALTPEQARALPGLVVLDFGTDWCGHCMAARIAVDAWMARHPDIRHHRIEDGRGRPLGRNHAVKLWPTLVLLRDGAEIARVVRPREERDLAPLDEALGGG